MYMEKEVADPDAHAGWRSLSRRRLDRLPPTRYFLGLVARIAIGGWFEFYEMFMAAYLALVALSIAACTGRPPRACST